MSKRQKIEPQFVPKVIEDDSDDQRYFFAFVPSQIEARDKYEPQMIGFPLNILFGGIRHDLQSREESLVHVCYEPAPETFRESSTRKEMRYFTRPKNGYSIRVIFEKKTGQWQTEKFKGERVISSAFGSTFDQAMLHATVGGPEADEC